jgi:ATP-dependent Clp protease adaptor protein ClpS
MENRTEFFTNWEEQLENIFSSSATENISEINYGGKPNFYNIFLINNQDIPVSFYVFIIEEYFNLEKDFLVTSFNKLRSNGYVSFGMYTKEIAESKISHIIGISRSSGYSLKCIMCKEHEYVIEKP